MTEEQLNKAAAVAKCICESRSFLAKLADVPNLGVANDLCVVAHQYMPTLDFNRLSKRAGEAAAAAIAHEFILEIEKLKKEVRSW